MITTNVFDQITASIINDSLIGKIREYIEYNQDVIIQSVAQLIIESLNKKIEDYFENEFSTESFIDSIVDDDVFRSSLASLIVKALQKSI